MLLASLTLRIGEDRAVLFPIINVRLPEMCTMYSQFGVDCPGCGLTRSFIHMSAGRISEAWRLNPVGLFAYTYMVMQLPLAAFHLMPANWTTGLRCSRMFVNWGWLNQWLFVALMIALPMQWIVRMVWKGLL